MDRSPTFSLEENRTTEPNQFAGLDALQLAISKLSQEHLPLDQNLNQRDSNSFSTIDSSVEKVPYCLPYELTSLNWDERHYTNSEQKYCYCGKIRTICTTMLQCRKCLQWFHVECLKSKLENQPLPGDGAYLFQCAVCTRQEEFFEFSAKNWTDIVRVAIYNLLLLERQKGSSKKYFQYKEEICSFINQNWKSLCYGKTRTKTWENTIGSALSTKNQYFCSGTDQLKEPGWWGLVSDEDPSLFRDSPNSTTKITSTKKKRPKIKKKRSSMDYGEEKVKVRKPKPIPTPIYLPRVYYDPIRFKYRELCLAKENSAPQVKIFPDRLTASNEKGYRAVRASMAVCEGSWYFELDIFPHSGNMRVGWSTEKGDVQAPIGYDEYSYSYRDKEGTKFHQSKGSPYGEPYGLSFGFLL